MKLNIYSKDYEEELKSTEEIFNTLDVEETQETEEIRAVEEEKVTLLKKAERVSEKKFEIQSQVEEVHEEYDYSIIRNSFKIEEITFPILETGNLLKHGFMTVDGRIGVIRKFPESKSLLTAFSILRKKYPYLHLQAQDFFGESLLSASMFLPLPKTGLLALLSKFSGDKHSTRIRDIWLHLLDITNFGESVIVDQYPRTEWKDNYHVLKYKYMSEWPPKKRAFVPIRGYCILQYPFQESVSVLYYTTLELRELLERNILCVEFVHSFKLLALYFWMPLGSCEFIAKQFKLIH